MSTLTIPQEDLVALAEFFAVDPTAAPSGGRWLTAAEIELLNAVIAQRSATHAAVADLQALCDERGRSADRAIRERNILAARCYEQSEIIRLMSERSIPKQAPVETHPIHTAIATMQRGGLR